MDPERRSRPQGGSTEPPSPPPLGAGAYAGMGLQFALSILLFVYAGQWVDGKLGTTPLFLVLGAFIGAGAGFYSMYRRLMADQQRSEDARKK